MTRPKQRDDHTWPLTCIKGRKFKIKVVDHLLPHDRLMHAKLFTNAKQTLVCGNDCQTKKDFFHLFSSVPHVYDTIWFSLWVKLLQKKSFASTASSTWHFFGSFWVNIFAVFFSEFVLDNNKYLLPKKKFKSPKFPKGKQKNEKKRAERYIVDWSVHFKLNMPKIQSVLE